MRLRNSMTMRKSTRDKVPLAKSSDMTDLVPLDAINHDLGACRGEEHQNPISPSFGEPKML
jgi:hypothetical protein